MTSYTSRTIEEIQAEIDRSKAEFSNMWPHVVPVCELRFMKEVSVEEIVRACFRGDDLLDEVYDWLVENAANGDYCIDHGLIGFAALNDAIFFKLRWC